LTRTARAAYQLKNLSKVGCEMKPGLRSLVILVAACACSSTPAKDDPAKAEKGAVDEGNGPAKEERKADEIVKEFDLNRDGKTDVWKFYRAVKDENGKTVQRLVRKELDINFDGKPDIWQYYDEKEQLEKVAFDLDFDGRPDQINYYEHGVIVKKEKDLNYDKKPDLWIYYEKGKIVRKERDTNGDGKVDYWEYWENDQIDRIGEDLDGDGTVDRWTKRNANE
jgi:antitoxin component YwqK of YwqJK toxin-antitoxin module